MASISSAYDKIDIQGHDGDRGGEYVDVMDKYTTDTTNDQENQNMRDTLKWLVIAFAIFGLLLVICLFLLIYFIADSSQKGNAKGAKTAALFDGEECIPDSFKVYVQQELEKQREDIRRIKLMVQVHIANEVGSFSSGGSGPQITNVKYQELVNDIILLKSSNSSIFRKARENQLVIDTHRNQLTLVSSKLDVQNRELNEITSTSLSIGKVKNDVVDLMAANMTLHSRYTGLSRGIQKHNDRMKLLNAKLSLVETSISTLSLDRVRDDLTTLKVWNKILDKKYLNLSIVAAHQRNQLTLLRTEVNDNAATLAQFQSADNDGGEFTRWYIKINNKVEHYKKVFMRTIDEINKLNTTRSLRLGNFHSPSKSQIIRYCTDNIPSTACSPCHCIATDTIYNKYVCDCSNLQHRKDCKEYYDSGFRINGIYTVTPPASSNNISVFCAHDDGGGWTVIQRRVNSDIGFYRNWMQYTEGFGDLGGNHYLGNEHISVITKENHEIKIDFKTFSGMKFYALYSHFSIQGEGVNFRLNCSGYSGNAGDSFCKYHSGSMFSTFDHDFDDWSLGNCAVSYRGGWWYKNCAHSNLNAHYFSTSSVCPLYTGIHWSGIGEDYNSLKETEMKIRKRIIS